MSKATVNEVTKFLEKAVNDLKNGGNGTWHMWLNDLLELDVGYMPGYDENEFEDGYAICAMICVNDDMPDIEWATMPYAENGDVWDTCMEIETSPDLHGDAEWYVEQAEEMLPAIESGEYKIPGYEPELEDDFNEWSNREIIDNIIENFEDITGVYIRDVFNYDDDSDEATIFNDDVVNKTSDDIYNYLSEHGLDDIRIEELLYGLDDELSFHYDYYK